MASNRLSRVSARVLLLFSAAIGQVAHGADSGAYFGGSASASRASVSRDDFGPLNFAARYAEDENDFRWSLLVGYRFGRRLSIEGGYGDRGRYRTTVTATSGVRFQNRAYMFDWRARSLFVAGKVSVDLPDGWAAFARLGVSVNRLTMRRTEDASKHIEPPLLPCAPKDADCYTPFSASPLFGAGDKRSEVGAEPLLGAGIEYRIGSGSAIRVSADDHGRFGERSKTGQLRVRTVELTYVQSF